MISLGSPESLKSSWIVAIQLHLQWNKLAKLKLVSKSSWAWEAVLFLHKGWTDMQALRITPVFFCPRASLWLAFIHHGRNEKRCMSCGKAWSDLNFDISNWNLQRKVRVHQTHVYICMCKLKPILPKFISMYCERHLELGIQIFGNLIKI